MAKQILKFYIGRIRGLELAGSVRLMVFVRVPTGQGKKSFKNQEKVRKFHCELLSQVKSKIDVCSQAMYGYDSLLVLITPFIEYVLKVTIKIIFHHSTIACKIYIY